MQERVDINPLVTMRISTISAGINGVLTNFLEVIKTRIIKDALNCDPDHYKEKGGHLLQKYITSEKGKIQSYPNCNECLPSRSS